MENVISKVQVGGTDYGIVPPSGLTAEQQAQARANIGAISAAEADVVSNGTYPEMTVGDATHAQTADNATNAVNAQKATADANGNNIPDTYLAKAQWLNQEHPVGSHHIQFDGEATPAARFGGTWEIDTDYTGRVLVGSGTGYALGATGGEATHNHPDGDLMTLLDISRDGRFFWKSTTGNTWEHNWSSSPFGTASENTGDLVYGIDVAGSTGNASTMQPYKVVAVWKRTA